MIQRLIGAALAIAFTLQTSPALADPENTLVISRQNRRVYLFGKQGTIVSYPIAIGKRGWETPIGTWRVFSKIKNPRWTNFRTRKVVPAGVNNPLGSRWIGYWSDGKDEIGFHGTKAVNSIGKPSSHGCNRMLEPDVRDLYDRIELGTVVKVVERLDRP